VLNRLSSWGLGSLGLLLLGVGPWLLYGVWRVLRDWPDAQGALLRWDAHAGRGGAYGSAWEFERRAERRPGEELHYQRVCREAQRAQEELNRDFPLPKPGAPSLILPVMLLALALSGLGQRQERLAREEKAEEQRREARAQAEAVRNVAEELAELQETGEESEAGRELAAAVEETAESLSGLEERDADDVINELSERARRLEELAKGLGEADGKWVSEHFGRTLAEQIDTEDLGEAVLDRDAERGAEEAGELSRHLAAESASGPFAVRMGQGLRRTMEAAAPEDEDRLLVQYVGDATEQLANGRPEGAAEAFQAMAGYFQGMVQSRRKQTRMEQLAEELRQAGMRIARQGGDSTKVAGTEPEAIPPGEARPLARTSDIYAGLSAVTGKLEYFRDVEWRFFTGVIVSALVFAWENARHIRVEVKKTEKGNKLYELHGPLFFGSTNDFQELFLPQEDPDDVIIEFRYSRVWDHSGLEAINTLAERYQKAGKTLHLRHLSPECRKLLKNAGSLVEVNVLEDPIYQIANIGKKPEDSPDVTTLRGAASTPAKP